MIPARHDYYCIVCQMLASVSITSSIFTNWSATVRKSPPPPPFVCQYGLTGSYLLLWIVIYLMYVHLTNLRAPENL